MRLLGMLIPYLMRFKKRRSAGPMSIIVEKKLVLLCCAITLAVFAFTSLETAATAASVSATARQHVVPSIISMTEGQTNSSTRNKENCEKIFVSIYIGKDSDSAFLSQTSAQCTNLYDIPAQNGSLIIIP
jgi:hypothetical protein